MCTVGPSLWYQDAEWTEDKAGKPVNLQCGERTRTPFHPSEPEPQRGKVLEKALTLELEIPEFKSQPCHLPAG